MKKIEHKQPKNAIGNHHGYQQWYMGTDIYFRSHVSNGKLVGYSERHKHTNFKWVSISETKFFIK